VEQCDQDGAGAGAEIGDAQGSRPRSVAVEPGERGFDHRLGVRARHQHGWAHPERQAPELLHPGDAGDRFAAETARDERFDVFNLGSNERPLAVAHEAGVVEPERMADDEARVEIGALDAGGAKPPGDGAPSRGDAQIPRGGSAGDGHARVPSASASSEAWCSVTNASMISSSASPSITAGSL
jgi:hypothetical protein